MFFTAGTYATGETAGRGVYSRSWGSSAWETTLNNPCFLTREFPWTTSVRADERDHWLRSSEPETGERSQDHCWLRHTGADAVPPVTLCAARGSRTGEISADLYSCRFHETGW